MPLDRAGTFEPSHNFLTPARFQLPSRCIACECGCAVALCGSDLTNPLAPRHSDAQPHSTCPPDMPSSIQRPRRSNNHQRPETSIKLASLLRRTLFSTLIFVISFGILSSHFLGYSHHYPFEKYIKDKLSPSYYSEPDVNMGGSDGYRSVAYFVNCEHTGT